MSLSSHVLQKPTLSCLMLSPLSLLGSIPTLYRTVLNTTKRPGCLMYNITRLYDKQRLPDMHIAQRKTHVEFDIRNSICTEANTQELALSNLMPSHSAMPDHFVHSNVMTTSNRPPFRVLTQDLSFTAAGVVKINNIPYTVSTQEIHQFISRFTAYNNERPGSNDLQVHIIMEKPTGKTMDCFVEFPNAVEAQQCVQRFYFHFGDQLDLEEHGFERSHRHQTSKLGTRNVTLDKSNQAELMHALFPRARFVMFDVNTGKPELVKFTSQLQSQSGWTQGFRGYITAEEVFGLVKFAEQPGRSPFALKCYSRVYESMISTLMKFPWPATKTYTIKTRNTIFQAANDQIRTLVSKLPSYGSTSTFRDPFRSRHEYRLSETHHREGLSNREVGLSPRLMLTLLSTALNVPAFSLLQQYALVESACSYAAAVQLHPCVSYWPFQTLMPEPDQSSDTLMSWLGLLELGSRQLDLGGKVIPHYRYIRAGYTPFGMLVFQWTELGIGLPFHDASEIEQVVVEKLLEEGRRAYVRQNNVVFQPMLPMIRPQSPTTRTSAIHHNAFSEPWIAAVNVVMEDAVGDDEEEDTSPRTSQSFRDRIAILNTDIDTTEIHEVVLHPPIAPRSMLIPSTPNLDSFTIQAASYGPNYPQTARRPRFVPSSTPPNTMSPKAKIISPQKRHRLSTTSQTSDLLLGSTMDIDGGYILARMPSIRQGDTTTLSASAEHGPGVCHGPIGTTRRTSAQNSSGGACADLDERISNLDISGGNRNKNKRLNKYSISTSSANNSNAQNEPGSSRNASGSSNTTEHSGGADVGDISSNDMKSGRRDLSIEFARKLSFDKNEAQLGSLPSR